MKQTYNLQFTNPIVITEASPYQKAVINQTSPYGSTLMQEIFSKSNPNIGDFINIRLTSESNPMVLLPPINPKDERIFIQSEVLDSKISTKLV
jgi:hypothetical protein